MIKPPSRIEWDTSALSADRRIYLDTDLSFEQMAAQVIEHAAVIGSRIEPYDSAPPGEKDGRQIIFVVRSDPKTCDLLYNASDGLRGRYWQSPDHGFCATKHLIDGLLPRLMSCAERHLPTPPRKCTPMSGDDIKASLEGLSAKVWPREKDDDRKPLWVDDQLKVLRWDQSEQNVEKGRQWRRSFTSGDLEIKGALIGIDRTEYIPEGKRDRSCQIHRFGYT